MADPKPPEDRTDRPAAGFRDEWFRTLAETTGTAIFVYDAERIHYANRAAEELIGLSPGTWTDRSLFEFIAPEELPRARERMARRLRGESLDPPARHYRLVTTGGESRWAFVTAGVMEIEGRQLLLGTAVDTTERRRMEEALRREQERAAVTLAALGDGVLRTDVQGVVEYLNPVAERLTGRRAEEAVGRPSSEVYRILDPASRKPFVDPIRLCLEKGRRLDLPGTRLLTRPDGEELTVRETVAPIREPDGRVSGAVLVFRDLSELWDVREEMERMSHRDVLTGLLHRAAFTRVLDEARRSVRPGGLVHGLVQVDLRGFQVVNDTLGTSAGDELLREVAQRLRRHGEDDDAVARLGSDEFGLLWRDVGTVEAARVRCDELLEELVALRFERRGERARVGAAIGLVLLDDPAKGHEELMQAVDVACAVAKEEGRNRVRVHDPDDRRLRERSGQRRWVARLQSAFEEDRFRLFRQVIEPFAIGEERAPMWEILLRLDEDGRAIAPGHFLHTAERHQLTPGIDRWVIRRLLQRLEADDDGESRYTVNLSGQSLGAEGFLDDVTGWIDASTVSPRRLCFEITETAAITHLAGALSFISVLRGMGCRFILDDFGSGLSSFAYLKNLAVDFLKIDRQFVSAMEDDPVQAALVRSIHRVGHDMGLATIAEGIETRGTFEALRDLGVDYGQGYWLARPEPFDAPR